MLANSSVNEEQYSPCITEEARFKQPATGNTHLRDIIGRVIRKQPLPEEDHIDVHENQSSNSRHLLRRTPFRRRRFPWRRPRLLERRLLPPTRGLQRSAAARAQ